jgi:hypothetical protein
LTNSWNFVNYKAIIFDLDYGMNKCFFYLKKI